MVPEHDNRRAREPVGRSRNRGGRAFVRRKVDALKRGPGLLRPARPAPMLGRREESNDGPEPIARFGRSARAAPRRWSGSRVGRFTMGSDRHYREEAPPHAVTVEGFWIDRWPVTNALFRQFVEETGLRHPGRDRRPIRRSTRARIRRLLVPASVVFVKPAARVDLRNHFNWWAYVPGADWRHPRGPESSIEGIDDHPVVHVGFDDADGVRELGGQGAADRGGVGVRRARRPGRRRVRLGRRARARRQADGELLAGRIPDREPAPRRLRGDVAGRLVSRRTAGASTT